jgi:hypothetical protein
MALIAKHAVSEALQDKTQQEPVLINVPSLVEAAKKAIQDSRDGILLPTLVKETDEADTDSQATAVNDTTTRVPQEKRKKKKKTAVQKQEQIETPSSAWYANPAMVLIPLAVIGLVVIARRAMSS